MSIRDLEEGGRWLLPDGVEEILPPRARHIELLRRRLLDLFDRWGYDLVVPPLIEYLESLLVGVGHDLDLQTFKVTDQLTGRMMGVRADLTSQAARIDAHSLGRDGPTRLCYAGTVLRARPEGLSGSRAPIRIGAELYGVPGPAGDAEVLALMGAMLRTAGLERAHVELGHVAVYRSLAGAAGLAPAAEAQLFDAVQRKARADVAALLEDVPGDASRMLRALPELYGGPEVLAEARAVLAGAPAAVGAALDELEAIRALLERRAPELELGFDLAELYGYHYHTGAVFSAYAPDHGRAVARGGRYDDIGGAFGRARPATGFDADLKVLAERTVPQDGARELVTAPDDAGLPSDRAAALWEAVAGLRARGVRVVVGEAPGATLRLEWRDGAWASVPLARKRADGEA